MEDSNETKSESASEMAEKECNSTSEEANEYFTWSCVRMVIGFTTVMCLMTLVYCHLAYVIIDQESKAKDNIAKEVTKDANVCGGPESFMIGDGICDELTNTGQCRWDGGDCCFDRSKKDSTLCTTCTCKVTVNTTELLVTFQSTEVRMFQNLSNYDSLIWETDKIVDDILSDEVCFTICLNFELQDAVNGWRFSTETNTCSCSWLKSTKCIRDMDLMPVTFQSYFALSLAPAKAFVQLAKTVDCNCLRLNQVFDKNQDLEQFIKKMPGVLSEWHCLKACQNNQDCTIFSWNFLDANRECYLLKSSSQHELSESDGWISGETNCNCLKENQNENSTTSEKVWPALYDNFKCQASASSVYNKADNFYGPGNAVDGTLMPVDAVTDSVLTFSYYKADPSDPNPWLQLDCGSPVSIAMVMITALYDIEVKKVDIYVGDKFAVLGQQSEKQLCASTVNDIPPRSYQVIDCNNTMYGQIVQFQMQTPMSLHEVIVFPATKWHHSNVTLSIDLKEKMVPRAQIASTASSIYEDYRSPTFLTDGILSASAIYFFHSDPSDPDPWIQMTVSQSWIITRVVVIQRLDCCADRFVNIQVHVGLFGVQDRKKNTLCTKYEGPSKIGAQDVLTCGEPVKGRKVFFSKFEFIQSPPQPLNMEEIILLGSPA